MPVTLVRSKFADDIKSEVVEHLVPAAFRDETKKQNLIPIGQPRVVELELEEDKPLRFKAVFEVLPPFEVAGYKEIKVAHEPWWSATRRCRRLLTVCASRTRPTSTWTRIAAWPMATIALGGVQEHQPGRGRRAGGDERRAGGYRRRQHAARRSANNLRGAKAGETRSFDVTYAEDFGDQRLAGKTLHYEVEVKGIKTKTRAGAERRVGEGAGPGGHERPLDDLRARMREGMEHEKKHQAEHRIKEELLRQLTDKFPIDVPTMLVENVD